jgi:hypothetical protein
MSGFIAALALSAGILAGVAMAQTSQNDGLLTNDDQSTGNTVSAYHLVLHGSPCDPAPCLAIVPGSPFSTQGGTGTNGGGIATPRIASFGYHHFCVFASNARDSSISAFQATFPPTLQWVDNYTSKGNVGDSEGIGLFQFTEDLGFNPVLIATYGGSKTLVTWEIGRHCVLQHPSKGISAVGLNGGGISSLAVNSIIGPAIAAYSDGSIGSYSVNQYGEWTLIGQEETTGFACGGIATSVVLSDDGYAIFGDTTSSTTEIETAFIGPTGVLSPTADFGGSCHPGQLGTGLGSSTISISANSRFLYVANTSSGSMDTEADVGGVVTWGHCPLTILRGFGTQWSTPAQMALAIKQGQDYEGPVIMAAEAGGGLSSGSFIGLLKADPTTGCMVEEPSSPTSDPNSPNLFSIALQSVVK